MTLLGLFVISMICLWLSLFQMPGHSYSGPKPVLTTAEADLKNALQSEVHMLSETIGPRNYSNLENLEASKEYLTKKLEKYGYQVSRQHYSTGDGEIYTNLSVEKRGTNKPDEIIVIGGHYDSAFNAPGANDNGTGVAATLELAHLFASASPQRTLRFVMFTNEEPPFFWTDQMGSFVYAKVLKQEKKILWQCSV